MITNVLFVLVILAEIRGEASTKTLRTNENDLGSHSRERENRDELTRIIKVLNGDTGFDSYYYFKNRGERNHIQKYKDEKVLQKKFTKEYNTKSLESGVRLHFIKNPDVLDRFIQKLKGDTSSSSSDSDSSSDDDRRHENDAADIRRNAVHRVQEASNENNDNPIPKDDINNKIIEENPHIFPPSIEDQITPFQTHFVTTGEQTDQNTKDSNLKLEDDKTNTKRFKVKSKRNKNKEKSTAESWDPYNLKKNENDNNKSKEKANDMWDKPDKIKEDKVKSEEKSKMDPWDRAFKKKEDKVQSKEKSNDPWDKPDKSKESKAKSEETLNNDLRHKPSKKKPKRDKFESEERSKNDNWDKPRNKKYNDRYDDDLPISDKKNNVDYKQKHERKKKKDWDELEKPTRQTKKKNFKDSKTYKDLWDSREIDWKKKKSNSFEDEERPKKKTKKWVEPKVKKTEYWEAPQTTKDFVDNDWDKVGKDWKGKKNEPREYIEKTTRWRQKKKSQNDMYNKPSYVARIPEYHHKYKNRDGGGSFHGRTPIPFVGKRGIYDDNK